MANSALGQGAGPAAAAAAAAAEAAARQAAMNAGAGYGGPPGGQYGPPGAGGPGYGIRPGSGSPADVYFTPVTSMVKGIDVLSIFTSDVEVDVKPGPILANESTEAFTASYAELGRQLMYAHMTTEFDDAIVTLRSVKFSPLLKRPTWNIRCGVSMAVRGGDSITDFQPIKEGRSQGSMASFGGPPPGMGGPPPGMGGPPPGMEGPPPGMGGPPPGMGGPPPGYGGPPGSMASNMGAATPTRPSGMEPPPMLSETTDEELQQHLGLVATTFAADFDNRFQSGDFGSLFNSITPPKPVDPRQAHNARTAPKKNLIKGELAEVLGGAPEPLPMWRPGLSYLGIAPSDEAIDIAKSNQIDVLFHFDVSVKEGRNNSIQNISRLRLIDVASGKSLVSSKSFDNQEVEQGLATRRISSSEDYIKDQTSTFWKIFDREVKAVPLPKLSPEVAKRRIATILASASMSPLETLAEIRMYQAMELINEEEAENAFFIVGGPEALVLMHGPLEERLGVAHEWALNAVGGAEER
ncbi:hypothetical protein N9N28_00190 [Rubripirellula amarantea]|nr:hypothetical protein [Rubripirellula amarantea]